MPARRILSIDDNPNTIMQALAHMRRLGLHVAEAKDLDDAASAVAHEPWDLLLVDTVIPDVEYESGGIAFVERLKNGEFGSRNVSVPFAILTAFPDRDIDLARRLQGFVAAISKTVDVVRALIDVANGDILSWFPRAVGDSGAAWARQGVLIIESAAAVSGRISIEGGDVKFRVPGWNHGNYIEVPCRRLPPEVLQEIDFGAFPLEVFAFINPDATRARDVMPHRFQLRPDMDPE